MKSKTGSNETLNKVLYFEMISINQLFLHARIYKNWGLKGLNEKVYKQSIHAMKRADKLIERILFLEGLPNLQNLGSLRIGEETEEMLNGDYALFLEQQAAVKDAIASLEQTQDYVSRDLLEEIQEEIEEFIDWLETQVHLIKETGLQNYQQSQMED